MDVLDKEFEEIISFLFDNKRPDMQWVSLQTILGLTGNSECLKSMVRHEKLLITLLSLLNNKSPTVSKYAALVLVNITADVEGANNLLKLNNGMFENAGDPVRSILGIILDPDSNLADQGCMILSNLTRPKHLLDIVLDLLEKSEISFDKIIDIFTQTKFNKNGHNLYYLGPLLSNLSQSLSVRKYILNKSTCLIKKMLAFTQFKDSIIKRGGVVGTVRNCCFETDYHEWLLSDEVDILPALLLPLADNTEFDEEDNDKLPLELQYLPDDKTREEDPDIRCMLLEAITQLCALRKNREYIRSKNAYVILRELHKWEKDEKSLKACENLVDILIRTEEEIGEDNLKAVEVPQDLQNKFDQLSNDI